MNIGGCDIVIDGSFSDDLIKNTIKDFWPEMVMIDSTSNDVGLFEKSLYKEFIVYSSKESQKVWDEHGLTDEFADEAVYIIVMQECIILVANNYDSSISKHVLAGLGKNGK